MHWFPQKNYYIQRLIQSSPIILFFMVFTLCITHSWHITTSLIFNICTDVDFRELISRLWLGYIMLEPSDSWKLEPLSCLEISHYFTMSLSCGILDNLRIISMVTGTFLYQAKRYLGHAIKIMTI